MQEDIIKDSKNYKQSKCQNVKKHTDALIIVQKDLQNCVKDFHKIRSEYKNEGDEKTNNKILKKNRKRIKPNASTTNAFVLSMLAANTHQVLIKMKFLLWKTFVSRTDTFSQTFRIPCDIWRWEFINE